MVVRCGWDRASRKSRHTITARDNIIIKFMVVVGARDTSECYTEDSGRANTTNYYYKQVDKPVTLSQNRTIL